MSNTSIQLKKSGNTGNTPSGLEYGELAVNYADGKLYYKDSTGDISFITNQESFATVNANSSLILATSFSDILSIVPGNNISIDANTTSKTITISSTGGTNTPGATGATGPAGSPGTAGDNGATGATGPTDPAAFDKANSAYGLAQDAYNYANTITGGGGGGGTTVTISDDNSSDATRYISFTDATSGDVSTLYTASANLTYNPATGTLGVNNLNVTPNTNIASFTTVVTGTSPVVLDSFSNTLYRGAFYQVQMESGGSFHLLNLSVVNSGSTAQVSAFGDAYNAGALATFGASVVDGQVQLIINPTTGSTTVSYLRHALVKLTIGVPAGDMGLVTDSVTSLFDCGFDLDTTTSSFDYGYLS